MLLRVPCVYVKEKSRWLMPSFLFIYNMNTNGPSFSWVCGMNCQGVNIGHDCIKAMPILLWEAGMVQWWERSPPTNVSWVWFPDPVSYVGWVCCWFSSLLWEVFLWYSGFPLSSKTNISKFQLDLDCQALYHEPLAPVIAQALPVFDMKFTFTFTFFTIIHVILAVCTLDDYKSSR